MCTCRFTEVRGIANVQSATCLVMSGIDNALPWSPLTASTCKLVHLQVAQVVGIDNVQSAIDDAKANAAFNNISNAAFVCGAAEKVMNTVLQVSDGQLGGWFTSRRSPTALHPVSAGDPPPNHSYVSRPPIHQHMPQHCIVMFTHRPPCPCTPSCLMHTFTFPRSMAPSTRTVLGRLMTPLVLVCTRTSCLLC